MVGSPKGAFLLGAGDRLIEPCAEGTQVHIHHAADTSLLDGGKCVDHEAKWSCVVASITNLKQPPLCFEARACVFLKV